MCILSRLFFYVSTKNTFFIGLGSEYNMQCIIYNVSNIVYRWIKLYRYVKRGVLGYFEAILYFCYINNKIQYINTLQSQ